MYHLKRASLGNPEFKQRILIMHSHNNSPGKDLATLQKEIYAFSQCLLGIHSSVQDLVVTDYWEF